MRFPLVVFSILLAVALPALAGDTAASDRTVEETAAPCSLAGVWYGGSSPNFPYTWTMNPINGGSFTTAGECAADPGPWGYTAAFPVNGVVQRTAAGQYEWWAYGYALLKPEVAEEIGVDPTLPEFDIVHSVIEFVDCNTITSTIDMWGWYYNFKFDRTPFVDPVDLSALGEGETLVETYYRLPMPAFGPLYTIPRFDRIPLSNGSARPQLPRRR